MIAAICAHTVCAVNSNVIEFLICSFELLILHSFYRRIERETPDHYLMLIEVAKENVISYYFKYIGFRFVPMFLICLLNYRLLDSFAKAGEVNIFIFNLILVLIELLFTNLSGAKKYWKTNLGYGHLLVGIFLLIVPLLSYYLYPLVQTILPSTQGVIDNIWSALIIFSLYSTILFLSRKNLQEEKRYPEGEDLLKVISKYEDLIEKQCAIYNANTDLVKAVAIYESLQRPKSLRLFERIFVFIFRAPTSQGIMQFTIDRVITDEESVILSVEKYFKNSASDPENYLLFRNILLQYNPSQSYLMEIQRLYWTISMKGFNFDDFIAKQPSKEK